MKREKVKESCGKWESEIFCKDCFFGWIFAEIGSVGKGLREL